MNLTATFMTTKLTSNPLNKNDLIIDFQIYVQM